MSEMAANIGTDAPVRLGVLRRLDESGLPQLAARLVVGGWFAYLAVLKLADPINFLKLTKLYNVVPLEPPILLNAIAIVMPYLELVCAAALVLGLYRRGAALLVSGMLVFFTPMLTARALDLLGQGKFPSFCAVKFDCGCGTGEVFICWKLTENLLLLVGALIVLVSRSEWLALDAWRARRRRGVAAERAAR